MKTTMAHANFLIIPGHVSVLIVLAAVPEERKCTGFGWNFQQANKDNNKVGVCQGTISASFMPTFPEKT
jgi:hypothetical protein